MNCPRCNERMLPVDLPQLEGDRVLVWLECPKCHFRTQGQR